MFIQLRVKLKGVSSELLLEYSIALYTDTIVDAKRTEDSTKEV
jgi:hypothetical protein